MVFVVSWGKQDKLDGEAVTAPPKKRAPRQIPSETPSPDDIQAVFGLNLRTARLRQRLTLEEVARRAGATFQYLSKVERGRANLTLSTAKRLAAAVGRSISSLTRPAARSKGDSNPPD